VFVIAVVRGDASTQSVDSISRAEWERKKGKGNQKTFWIGPRDGLRPVKYVAFGLPVAVRKVIVLVDRTRECSRKCCYRIISVVIEISLCPGRVLLPSVAIAVSIKGVEEMMVRIAYSVVTYCLKRTSRIALAS